MGGLSDLDFTPGLEFQRLVHRLHDSPVSFSSSPTSKEFFLVASFGRCAIRLNPDSAALIIQSCLGGLAKDFRVVHLSGFMFRFSVDSKVIGIMIARMWNFSCPLFAIFFALWGNNGPNWRKEYDLWVAEAENAWTHVTHNKRSYAQVTRDGSGLPPFRKSVFSRIDIPLDHHMFSSRSDSSVHQHKSVSSPDASHRKPGSSASQVQNSKSFDFSDARINRLCFRCLSPGHLISTCRNFWCAVNGA